MKVAENFSYDIDPESWHGEKSESEWWRRVIWSWQYIIVIVVDNVEGVVECGAVHGTGATGGDTEDGLGWWRPGLATSASGSLAQPSSRAASAAQ